MTDLAQRFLARIAALSTREAQAETGISFSTIARLRRLHALEQPLTSSAWVGRAMQSYLDGRPPDGKPQTQHERIEALQERVRVLEERVFFLEKTQGLVKHRGGVSQ